MIDNDNAVARPIVTWVSESKEGRQMAYNFQRDNE